MSASKSHISGGARAFQGMVGQFGAIVEKAVRTDEQGVWGVDPWITLIHDLIDLQIRTTANVVQLGLAGPWWLQPPNWEPPLSDPIAVTPAPHDRVLTVAEPFARIGRAGSKIPDTAFAFEPAVLPAGAKSFRMRLIDTDYVGANYAGKIGFRRTQPGGPGGSEPPLSIVVGL